MSELYISSETKFVSLKEVMDCTSVYFQHMTAQELYVCLTKPVYNGGDLASVLLTLLEKAKLDWEVQPDESMVITTCYGEPCILSSKEIFGY